MALTQQNERKVAVFARGWEGVREDSATGTEVQSTQTREVCSFTLSFTMPEYATWLLRLLTILPA